MTTYGIHSTGRDASGADTVTILGQHADDIAGGVGRLIRPGTSPRRATVLIVSAMQTDTYTKVFLPNGAIDPGVGYTEFMVATRKRPVATAAADAEATKPTLVSRIASWFKFTKA